MAREQLKGYPAYLRDLRDAVADFQAFLQNIDGLELVTGASASVQDCAFTQIVLRLDEGKIQLGKARFREMLSVQGIATWHANFEAITSLSFFQEETWRNWILLGDVERAAENYGAEYPVHQQVYNHSGLGIAKTHFASPWRLRDLKVKLLKCLSSA